MLHALGREDNYEAGNNEEDVDPYLSAGKQNISNVRSGNHWFEIIRVVVEHHQQSGYPPKNLDGVNHYEE